MRRIAIPLGLSFLLLATPVASSTVAEATDQETNCLALNLYYEARGLPDRDLRAVADVTLNRASSGRFPRTICEVVYQRGQFSWTFDQHSNVPRDRREFERAQMIAGLEVAERILEAGEDITRGALYFYAHRQVYPRWASRMQVTMRTPRGHTFLRPYR